MRRASEIPDHHDHQSDRVEQKIEHCQQRQPVNDGPDEPHGLLRAQDQHDRDEDGKADQGYDARV